MSYSQMINILRQKHKEEILLINSGAFYITEPKLTKIEKSKYIDRIVHRWYVNSFMEK